VSSRKYARQARLAEVGIEGQARIEGTSVAVQDGPQDGPSLAHEMAVLYLVRAGARPDGTPGMAVVCRDYDLPLSAGPRDVAVGALAALVALRAILGVGSATDVLMTSSAR
jgi:hypothetical protein